MSGSPYCRLLLRPLFRGSLLTLAVAALALGCLRWSPVTPLVAASPVLAATAPRAPAAPDQRANWPRTALRLWFLVPQLLPTHDR